MWTFNMIYRGSGTVKMPVVYDLSFNVAIGVTDVTIDVSIPLSEFNYGHVAKNREIDGWVTDDNGNVVAFGVCTRISIDTENESVRLVFSGVPQLLRGAILSNALDNRCETSNDNAGRTEIKASSKLGVVKNIIKYVSDSLNGDVLPFVWGGAQQSGTAYLYAFVNGDWKNLREVLDQYIDNENVAAFKFTYTPYQVGTNYEEVAVDISAISSQTEAISIDTRNIRRVGTLEIDSSATVKQCFVLAPVENSNNLPITRHSRGTASLYTPNRCVGLIGNQKIVGTNAASSSDCQRMLNIGNNRCNQLPACSLNVTLSQISYTGNVSFNPTSIGKIISFLYLVGGTVYYLFGVVAEATYKNLDTIELKLSNVTLSTSNTLDYERMRRQISTPKTTTNLLNTLANNLGTQSAREMVS